MENGQPEGQTAMNVGAKVEAKPRITAFTFPNADVTFRSRDGVNFSVDKKRLDFHADGFPPCELETSLDEAVPLSEDATTLELLFQSIYPRRMPDVNSLQFQTLINLADAAEKYEVSGLMYICNTRIRAILPNHATEILAYAARYDYPEIISELAPQIIDKSMSEMYQILPTRHFAAWVKYMDHWHRVRLSASRPTHTMCNCNNMSNTFVLADIFRRLADLKSLQNLSTTFGVGTAPICNGPGHMSAYITQWKENVKGEVENIPKFIELIN